MNKIKALIVEDEIPAARLLAGMLRSLRPEWDVEIIGGTVEGAVEWFSKHPDPDLLFLDIQLTDGNSFHFLEQSRPLCPVVFTTAYDEYAIRAFSVNSIAYLLKPFDEKKLEETLLKYESLVKLSRRTKEETANSLLEVLSSIVHQEKKYRTRFLLTSPERLWTLLVNEVAFFVCRNRITIATTHSGDEHLIDLTLDKLTEQLDPDRFFRANRQTIVQIDAIKKIEPYFNHKVIVIVSPAAPEKIIVSKEKLPRFKEWLNY